MSICRLIRIGFDSSVCTLRMNQVYMDKFDLGVWTKGKVQWERLKLRFIYFRKHVILCSIVLQKNLHRYEFCVCCGGITPYQVDTPVWMREYYIEGCGQLCRYCYFEISTSMKGGLDVCKQTDAIFADNDLGNWPLSAGSKELKATGREQIPGCVGVIVVMNLLFLAQILSEDIPKAVAASNWMIWPGNISEAWLYLADRTSTRPEGKGVYASGSANAIAGPLHIKQQIPWWREWKVAVRSAPKNIMQPAQ